VDGTGRFQPASAEITLLAFAFQKSAKPHMLQKSRFAVSDAA